MKYYMFNGLKRDMSKNKPKKEINKKKVIKVVIIILVILLFITMGILYAKNNNVRNFFDKYIFRKEVKEENLPTIELEGVKETNVYAYKNYIVIIDDNLIKMYNKSAKEECSLHAQISNPIFESNGDYLCIAEKGGQKLYLIKDKNLVWQKDIEGNISSVNVNSNGYVSITISRNKL